MELKRTPLHGIHLELGATMTEFSGWDMPLHYGGIVEEHMRVRHSCGMFDVSHMGDIVVEGPQAPELLGRVLSNNIALATPGKAIYSHMLRPDGSIIDDLIVQNLGEGRYLLVPNASTLHEVLTWLQENNNGAEITDYSENLSSIAIQGPLAEEVFQRLTEHDLSSIGRFRGEVVRLKLDPGPQRILRTFYPELPGDSLYCLACRVGYTGEDGFELCIEADQAPILWRALLEVGGDDIGPAGLGCRDTLRLEKGLLLSGSDFNGTQTPLQTGPRWVVKMDRDFIGREALEAQEDEPDLMILAGLMMEERGIPREGHKILKEGEQVGRVTSGTMSPMLRKGIALGYIPRSLSRVDEELQIEVRGKALAARVVSLPFV